MHNLNCQKREPGFLCHCKVRQVGFFLLQFSVAVALAERYLDHTLGFGSKMLDASSLLITGLAVLAPQGLTCAIGFLADRCIG